MRPVILALAALACSAAAPAQYADVRVGLYGHAPAKELMVMGDQGPLAIIADGRKVAELSSSDGLVVRAGPSGMQARSLLLNITAAKSLSFTSPGGKGFRLRNMDPRSPERAYPGSLQLTAGKGGIRATATVPLEQYVAGVVQAEAGKGHDLEYYKLQAVSCRTYALANKRRHAGEGFEVCDATHCQVFQGKCRNDSIRMAVDITRDLVVVDADIHLIHATFHSNCGGETMNAEDLWSKSEPYLVSTMDTFCLHAPHAVWTKQLPRGKWLGYLHDRFGVDTDDSNVVASVTDHVPACRELYLANISPLVPLEQVRHDFGLRSAYFSVHPEGDEVVLSGRGFGHGVGLCQEGAMRMARDGFSYEDILHHYFANVHLVKLQNLDFFRDDGL